MPGSRPFGPRPGMGASYDSNHGNAVLGHHYIRSWHFATINLAEMQVKIEIESASKPLRIISELMSTNVFEPAEGMRTHVHCSRSRLAMLAKPKLFVR